MLCYVFYRHLCTIYVNVELRHNAYYLSYKLSILIMRCFRIIFPAAEERYEKSSNQSSIFLYGRNGYRCDGDMDYWRFYIFKRLHVI